MKKMRFLICLLTVCSLTLSGVNVMAADVDTKVVEQIQPRFENMGTITATISINEGVATCTGKVTMEQSKKSIMTVTLQRRTSGGAFSTWKTWSEEFTGAGTKSIIEKQSLSSGYYYRVQTVVQVYSGTTFLEAGAAYSPEKYY